MCAAFEQEPRLLLKLIHGEIVCCLGRRAIGLLPRCATNIKVTRTLYGYSTDRTLNSKAVLIKHWSKVLQKPKIWELWLLISIMAAEIANKASLSSEIVRNDFATSHWSRSLFAAHTIADQRVNSNWRQRKAANRSLCRSLLIGELQFQGNHFLKLKARFALQNLLPYYYARIIFNFRFEFWVFNHGPLFYHYRVLRQAHTASLTK